MEYVSVFRDDCERVEEVSMPNYLSEIENDLDTAYHSTKNEKVAHFIDQAISSLHAAKRQYSGSNTGMNGDRESAVEICAKPGKHLALSRRVMPAVRPQSDGIKWN